MATATTSKTLTSTYQSIGAGPGVITMEEGFRAEVHLTPGAAPVAGSAFHSLFAVSKETDRSWTEVPVGMTAYARKRSNDGDTAISFTQS